WHLVTCEMFAAEGAKLFWCHRHVLAQFDEAGRGLAPFVMRSCHNSGQQDSRMAVQNAFNLEAGDVLATGDNDVLGAVTNLDIAIGMVHGKVASMEHAPLKRLFG